MEKLLAITLNAAKILSIDEKIGSLEAGKDANLFVCNGDALDLRTNLLTNAFIQGRETTVWKAIKRSCLISMRRNMRAESKMFLLY